MPGTCHAYNWRNCSLCGAPSAIQSQEATRDELRDAQLLAAAIAVVALSVTLRFDDVLMRRIIKSPKPTDLVKQTSLQVSPLEGLVRGPDDAAPNTVFGNRIVSRPPIADQSLVSSQHSVPERHPSPLPHSAIEGGSTSNRVALVITGQLRGFDRQPFEYKDAWQSTLLHVVEAQRSAASTALGQHFRL